MANQTSRPELVRNILFPHIAGTQPQITLTGNPNAISELSTAILRGFVADTPQDTVYHATGHYITRYLAGAGEPIPTVQNLQLVYYGAGFRTTVAPFLGLAPGHPFFEAHQNRQPAGNLENNHFMIPYLFQAWFIQRARRMGGSPVTRVGVVVRNVSTHSAEDTYTVSMYNNSSSNPADSLVWFVYDPSVDNPWATLTKPQPAPSKLPAAGPSISAAGPSAPNTPIFAAGPRRRPPPITGPVRPGATPRVTAAAPANNAAPSAPVTPAVPNTPVVPRVPAIPNILAAPVAPTAPVNTKNTKIVPRKIAPTPAKNEKQRKIDNAPDWNTALPWDLLADCTLEELVIYYPNHVFNHPGLALLFVHYSHRIAGKNRSFTGSAERILAARGKKTEKDDKKKKKGDKEKKDDKLSSMLRQWVLMAVGEILKHYNAAEADHLTGVYALLNDRGVNNVMELFQMEYMRVPARFRTSMQPAVPLHEVGAYIKGAHPTGNFANRVQRAMHYHRMGINEPAVSPPRSSGMHPMIALLRDYTANIAQRFQEETFLYNQTAPIDGLIRPQKMFPDEIFQRDSSGLIWQMTRQHERVIDVLNHNLNRRHVLENYWSDLRRDTWLWIDLGMAPEEWKSLLPRGALLQHGCLDEDGNVVKEKLDDFQATQRKTAQMSLQARIKGVKDSQWNKKLSETDPYNKALYDEEKNKWDAWSEQQSDYRNKGKGNAGKRTVEGMEDESEEEGNARGKKRVRVRKTGAAAATQTPTAPQQPSAPTFQQPLPTIQEQTLGELWFAPYDQYGLYNVDPSGNFMNVPFLPGEFAGNGTMPQWWRDARRLLFRLRGITPPASMEESFDQAIDVVPNPDPTPGAPALHFQADFRAPPTPSPPRFSPQQPIGNLPSAGMDQDNTMLLSGAPSFGAFQPNTINPSFLSNGAGGMMEGLVYPDPTFGNEAEHMNFALGPTLNSGMNVETPGPALPYLNQPIGDIEPLFSNAELGQFMENAQTGWTPPEGASPDSQPGLTDAMFAGAHTQEQSQPLRRSPRRRSNGSSSAGSAGTSGSKGKRRSPRNHPGSDW